VTTLYRSFFRIHQSLPGDGVSALVLTFLPAGLSHCCSLAELTCSQLLNLDSAQLWTQLNPQQLQLLLLSKSQLPLVIHKPEGREFNPDEIIGFLFNLPNPFSCTVTLESTQPLTETSTRNQSQGHFTADSQSVCLRVEPTLCGTDHTGNTAFNSSPIVECLRCLAMAVFSLLVSLALHTCMNIYHPMFCLETQPEAIEKKCSVRLPAKDGLVLKAVLLAAYMCVRQ
jgi:hypothetical protein